MARDERFDLDALDDQLDRALGERDDGHAGLVLTAGIVVALGMVLLGMPSLWAGYALLAGTALSAIVHTVQRASHRATDRAGPGGEV